MCLKATKRATNKLIARIKKNSSRTITAYKVLRRYRRKLISVHRKAKYHQGTNYSDRPSHFATPVKFSGGRLAIFHGSHVYLTREEAKENSSKSYPVVPVRCQLKDVVAAGTCRYYGDHQSAVFTKVYISPREYRKATNP